MTALGYASRSAYRPGVINDDAVYYLGAVSLARDGRYLNLAHPDRIPQRNYFPGYPLLLAPVLKVFPDGARAARALNLALSAAALGLLFFLAARLLGPLWGLLACAWTLLLPANAIWSTALVSEIPYLALSLLFLSLSARARPAPAPALLALGAALFWIRPAALALLLAYALWSALRGERRAARWGLAVAAALFVWSLAWANAGASASATSYHRQLLAFLSRGASPFELGAAALAKAALYARELAGTLLPWSALASRGLAGVALALLLALPASAALAAAAREPLRGPWGLLSLYAALYLGLHVLLWPSASGRYLLPLLPVLYCLLAAGFKRLSAAPGWRAALGAWIALSLGFECWGLRRPLSGAPSGLPRLPRETFSWMAASLPRGGVVAAETAATVHLYTGLSAVSLPYAGDPDLLHELLARSGAEYVLLRGRQDVHRRVGGAGEAADLSLQESTLRHLRASPSLERLWSHEEEGTELLRLRPERGRYRAGFERQRRAEELFRAGQRSEAEGLFREALSLAPELCGARNYLAALSLGRGDARGAEALLAQAVRSCPGQPLLRLNHAKSLGASGRFAAAGAELEAAISLGEASRGLKDDRRALETALELRSQLLPARRPSELAPE